MLLNVTLTLLNVTVRLLNVTVMLLNVIKLWYSHYQRIIVTKVDSIKVLHNRVWGKKEFSTNWNFFVKLFSLFGDII